MKALTDFLILVVITVASISIGYKAGKSAALEVMQPEETNAATYMLLHSCTHKLISAKETLKTSKEVDEMRIAKLNACKCAQP